MEVGFHHFEDRVVLGAVLTAAVLPALALMAEVPGGDDVLPLYPIRPLFIFSGLVAAGG